MDFKVVFNFIVFLFVLGMEFGSFLEVFCVYFSLGDLICIVLECFREIGYYGEKGMGSELYLGLEYRLFILRI